MFNCVLLTFRCDDFVVCLLLRYRAVSDLVEELLSSPRYNSRTRPASDRGL